jgi:hypothetical protein
MLPFLESFLAIIAAFIFPALLGLLVISALARLARPRYLAAFALGIFFWFFSDTIGGSSYLDVNSGFTGGAVQLGLVVLFVVGVLLLFFLDRTIFNPGPAVVGMGFSIPLLVAFAVGIHGFGEGAGFSVTAAATPSTNLFDAFGGVTAAVAFILHKAIEPMMIGATYWVYAKDRAKSAGDIIRDLLLLTFVFILPGVVGAATDYFLNYDTTYFFALGTGTSIYAAVRLAKPLFWEANLTSLESVKVAVLFVIGFLCIYFAALFHS